VTVEYHVYSNDHAGGPVNYQTPIATVATTSFVTPPLAAVSDTTFAVRAFDPSSGLEEANVDARVRILLDSQANDITGRPAQVLGLSARPRGGGAIVVRWLPNPSVGAGKPAGYHVYFGTPIPAYAAPAATVADTGRRDYSATIPGLADGSCYQFVVRAYNAFGEEQNTNAISAVASVQGPNAVDGLSAAASFQA
jgi:hypothetical protein